MKRKSRFTTVGDDDAGVEEGQSEPKKVAIEAPSGVPLPSIDVNAAAARAAEISRQLSGKVGLVRHLANCLDNLLSSHFISSPIHSSLHRSRWYHRF